MTLLLLLRPHSEGGAPVEPPVIVWPLGTAGTPRHRSTTMPMTTYKIGDRLPVYTATLLQGAGTPDEEPLDLTTATGVEFILREVSASTNKVEAPADYVADATGTVSYEWGATDLNTAGRYLAEWRITYPATLPTTVPSRGHDIIIVTAGHNTT